MNRTTIFRLLAAALTLTFVLAGCGSDDDGGDDVAASPSGSASGAAGPITIEHSRGTIELDAPAERIVTIGVQWTDAVLALGAQPVAVEHDTYAGEDGRYPWHEGVLDDDVVGIQAQAGVAIEQVAAAEPDLILIGWWYVPDDATYETLSAIAPTITGLAGGDKVDRWQDMVTVVGQALDKADEAEQVIADVEAEIAAVGEALPGLAGKTFAMANVVPGDGIYVVADLEDGSSQLFQGFGMELAPSVLEAAEGSGTARPKFSFEQLSLLDADLLVVFSQGGDPTSTPGWDNLPSVRSGAAVVLDYEPVVGLNTPTPFGLPYALEQIRPALEAAAK